MSATQLSFPAFAAAQAAASCTPPASTPSVPADVVAHGTGSGGECIPHADYSEFCRLVAMADTTVHVPYRMSRGGYVLLARANVCAPLYPGDDFEALFDLLRDHADRCIQLGC